LSTGRNVCLLNRKVCELVYDVVARVVLALPGRGSINKYRWAIAIALFSHFTGVIDSSERYNKMPGQKILVVDDSWTELTMIVTPLRNNGFDVVTAVDGDEAVEKVFRERPQCIVLDVVLPKQNGFQLCRKLKSFEGSKHIPIILLTSKNTALDRSWGLRQGADLYITKPFNSDELVASVRSLV